MTQSFSLEQFDIIEDLAEAFREGRPKFSARHNASRFVELSHFSGAVPLIRNASLFPEESLFFRDCTPDMFGHINVVLAGNVFDGGDRDLCSLRRLRRLTPTAASKIPGASAGVFELSTGVLKRDRAPLMALANLFRYRDRGYTPDELAEGLAFQPVFPQRFDSDILARDRQAIQIMLGALLTIRYCWRVDVSYDAAPSVGVLTSCAGARELFKFRDKSPALNRRAALRHWVREHARLKSEGVETQVREHLRGATQFTWNGLKGSLKPSYFDFERSLNSKLKRDAARVA